MVTVSVCARFFDPSSNRPSGATNSADTFILLQVMFPYQPVQIPTRFFQVLLGVAFVFVSVDVLKTLP